MSNLEMKSGAFSNSEAIPKKFTQEGENLSPPLEWSGRSPSVEEFALICEDPDAPKNAPYIHWVIYGIAPDLTSLPEGIPAQAELTSPLVAKQGRNSSGGTGYTGPLPPLDHGWHRYYFRLFALDKKLNLPSGLTSDELLDAIRNNILAEAETMGRYQRPMSEPEKRSSPGAEYII